MSRVKHNKNYPKKISCPCGGQFYETCCKPWHIGGVANTAEQLMKSRYSAYAMGLTQYVLDTWHPSTRPQSLDLSAPEYAGRWLGLDVKCHQTNHNQAEVQFTARFKPTDGAARRIFECSRFIHENHQWFYVDAKLLIEK